MFRIAFCCNELLNWANNCGFWEASCCSICMLFEAFEVAGRLRLGAEFVGVEMPGFLRSGLGTLDRLGVPFWNDLLRDGLAEAGGFELEVADRPDNAAALKLDVFLVEDIVDVCGVDVDAGGGSLNFPAVTCRSNSFSCSLIFWNTFL